MAQSFSSSRLQRVVRKAGRFTPHAGRRGFAFHDSEARLPAEDGTRQSTVTSRRSFEILAPFLDPENGARASFESAARDLGISIEAVRQGVSRMRRKFREFLRRQIAATLKNPNPEIEG